MIGGGTYVIRGKAPLPISARRLRLKLLCNAMDSLNGLLVGAKSMDRLHLNRLKGCRRMCHVFDGRADDLGLSPKHFELN